MIVKEKNTNTNNFSHLKKLNIFNKIVITGTWGGYFKTNNMKTTAMQEIIDSYHLIDKFTDFDTWIANNEKRLLEKEKEQIITAFEDGYKSCDIDEAFEINRKLASGEQYYNKTFNK